MVDYGIFPNMWSTCRVPASCPITRFSDQDDPHWASQPHVGVAATDIVIVVLRIMKDHRPTPLMAERTLPYSSVL
jgi:hypothetical protein